MASFQDFVLSNVRKNVSEEEAREFPIPIAINAFRGYLDEFQKCKKPTKKKPIKQNKKVQRKKVRDVSRRSPFIRPFIHPFILSSIHSSIHPFRVIG